MIRYLAMKRWLWPGGIAAERLPGHPSVRRDRTV